MKLLELDNYINSLSAYTNYDSGIINDCGIEVNNILMALDYEDAINRYAESHNIDTIIIHHSIGHFYYTAYKGILNKLEVIHSLGLPSIKYESLVNRDMMDCFLQMRNTNMVKMIPSFIDAHSKMLSLMISHHVPDNLVYKKIKSLVYQTNNPFILYKFLKELILDFDFFPQDEAIKIYTNVKEYTLPFIDICFVSSASSILQKELLNDGIDLLVVTTTSPEVIDFALNHNKTIILLNHIPYDYLGLDLLKSHLVNNFQLNIEMYEKK